jgi:AraC-type DNA-binding domain-containing proteins
MVFRFDYSDTDYEHLLQLLAQKLDVPVQRQTLQFPESVADGHLRFFKLPNGLQACMVDCTFNQDWHVQRRKSTEEIFTLHFDEMTINGSLIITIGEDRIKEKSAAKSLAYITSSMFDWSYTATRGCVYKGLSVLFNKEWLVQYVNMHLAEELLTSYIQLKTESIKLEPLNARYRRWIKTMCQVDDDNPLQLLIIQNRIMLMIEMFFTNILAKMRNPDFRIPLSQEDIDRVMNIERLLTKNVFQPPPSIQQLARIAAVSESKLKKDFKTVYGLPIYEYFQKTRMHAAQDRLLTGKYSVKEVAMELGYSNLSNFTIAFKKEFGILPSQLLSGKRPNE